MRRGVRRDDGVPPPRAPRRPCRGQEGERAVALAVHGQRQMGTATRGILEGTGQNVPQMRLVQHNDVIEHLPTDAPYQPFHVTIPRPLLPTGFREAAPYDDPISRRPTDPNIEI